MSSIILRFAKAKVPTGANQPPGEYRANLSALAFAGGGRVLFFGGDETVEEEPTIEMLTQISGGNYAGHKSLKVSTFIALPDPSVNKGRVGEIDIEGLANDGGYLWIIGSHSCNRKQPKIAEDGLAKSLKRLAEVQEGSNRFFLGRIPLKDDGTTTELMKSVGGLKAGRLLGDESDGQLLKDLSEDDHFAPFFALFKNHKGATVRLPSKDNGFDIEGLAVRGDRVFIGLRGPVLRGWACILELKVQGKGVDGDFRLTDLMPGGAGEEARLYRKHFVALDGLGIRDLELDGDNLLILAGPTMALDGPARVFEWTGALGAMSTGDTLTPQAVGTLEKVIEIPVQDGHDHPEGIALIPPVNQKQRNILAIYDSPAKARLVNDTDVSADVFAL